MAVQLALDEDNWDLVIDDTGNLTLVEDGAEVVQHLRQRINFFRGEWPWDLRAGVPWFGEILGARRFTTQQENRVYAESLLKLEILETDGVTRLLEFDFSFEPVSRNATFNFRVDTVYGDAGTSFFDLSIDN